jgi:hypothetical protein
MVAVATCMYNAGDYLRNPFGAKVVSISVAAAHCSLHNQMHCWMFQVVRITPTATVTRKMVSIDMTKTCLMKYIL